MKRKLTKQMVNEWRSNVWLCLELLIVSAIITVAIYPIFCSLRIYYMPMNINTDRTYMLSYRMLPEVAADYDKSAEDVMMSSQVYNLLRVARNHPIVEAASMSQASVPYSSSRMSSMISLDTARSMKVEARYNFVSRDFPQVFYFVGTNGETPEQLMQVLKDGKAIITRDLFDEKEVNATSLINKSIYDHFDNPFPVGTVGAVIEPSRFNDYETKSARVIMPMEDGSYNSWPELAVRIRADFNGDVKETLLNEIRSGNLYITMVTPITDMRQNELRDQNNDIRNKILIVAFLLFNLFLGILGTFWLRTLQRTGEIAIRKVNGASNASILSRLVNEGLLLVVFSSIMAFSIAGVVLKHVEIEIFNWQDTAICAVMTFATIVVMTILGTLPPAFKAIRVNPAEALKSE